MATFLFSNVNCNARAAHPQLSNMKDCQNRSNDTLPNEPTAYDNNMYLTLKHGCWSSDAPHLTENWTMAFNCIIWTD